MYINKLIEQTNLDPQMLLEILKKVNPEAEKLDFHQFIGIENLNSKNKGANYCPAISFIQLFFHCDMVYQILSQKNISKNHQIVKFFKMIYNKEDNYQISFNKFAQNWKGWNKKLIPKDKFDTNEFIQYFFESCPIEIQDLFYFNEEGSSNLLSPCILYVSPKQDTLQNIINNTIDQIQNIIFSNYLIISVNRKEQHYINHTHIKINTYLQIFDQNFKFNGATTFSKEHYHSIIKICDQYFLFDDAEVCPLFSHENCCPEVFNLMDWMNNEFKSNTSIILYQKIEEKSIDSNLYENILQEEEDNDSSSITTFNMNDIHGFILTKYNDTLEANQDEIFSCEYSNLRKLFEISGKIFKELNYCLENDLFQYTKTPKQKDDSVYMEIADKGQILKAIFEEIVDNDNYNYQFVNSKVQEILDWYYNKFENLKREDIHYESIINNSLTELVQLTDYNDEELDEYNEDELNEPNDDEINNSDKKQLKESKKTYNFSQSCNLAYKKNSSSICKQRKIDDKQIELTNNSFNDDDNQFSLIEYDWSNRLKVDNVTEILSKMRRLLCGVKTIEGKKSTELRDLIIKELLGFYVYWCNYCGDDNVIIKMYINLNCNQQTITENVRLFKELHKKNIEDEFIKIETLKKKVNEFKELTFAEKCNFFNCEQNNYKWGGSRGNFKITNDTIRCLMALMIDFPSMSTISYTSYINSKYGPNENNKVQVATIRKYVRNLDYSIKLSKFHPPNRNCIGISVYRAAWSSIILEIINDENVVPAFLDEATIIAFREKQKSYSFIGMSPTIRNKGNTILSVISMAIPYFGLIYRFINGEITSQDHVSFLKDSSDFIKNHMNKKCIEIIVFEDNTPIHNDEINNEEIDQLKITVLPISPGSSSLNHVIGQYLSFIKTSVFVNKKDSNITYDVNVIMQKWEELTNNGYSMSLINQSFNEWIDILQQFSNGNQIND